MCVQVSNLYVVNKTTRPRLLSINTPRLYIVCEQCPGFLLKINVHSNVCTYKMVYFTLWNHQLLMDVNSMFWRKSFIDTVYQMVVVKHSFNKVTLDLSAPLCCTDEHVLEPRENPHYLKNILICCVFTLRCMQVLNVALSAECLLWS